MELGYQTSRPALSDSLPPALLHLLKVPQPFSTSPPAEDQVFKHWSLWGTSTLNHNTLVCSTQLASFIFTSLSFNLSFVGVAGMNTESDAC